MKKALLCSLLAVATLAGCASVNSVSLTPIPSRRNQVVTATVEKFIILGFNFDNDFVDQLVQDLKKKCPDGVVSGILTKDEVIMYFFAHNHRITATGFCNKATVAVNNQKRGAASEASGVDAETN